MRIQSAVVSVLVVLALSNCAPEVAAPTGGGTGGSLGGGTGGSLGGGTGGSLGGGTGGSLGGGTGGSLGGGTGGSLGGGTGGSLGGGTGGSLGGGTGGGSSGGGGGGASGGGSGGVGGFALGPSGCAAQALEASVSVGGYLSDRYAWSDGACLRRTAALVRNTGADPGGSRGGFLRELTLTVNGAVRTARGTGANGWNGWGYVVNHYASSADTSRGRTGTFRTVLAGAHHAIHEFKVQMNPGGPVNATVQWFFATGRSEPVVSISYDVTASANAVTADTRAPYGDLAFEGTAGPIGGIGWGDLYQFTTTGAGPVTLNSAWDYTTPNLVPYVRMWSSAVDAEMGAVQTQTFAQHVAGGDYGGGMITACQGKTSATKGTGCSTAGQVMPVDWLWPFQLNQYELPFANDSHRLAWGSNYGAIGNTSVTAFGHTFSGFPKVSYAVFLVVGAHSTADTMKRVTQVERLTSATVSTASWNPAFAGWDVPTSPGTTTVSLDPHGAALAAPLLRFTQFTAAQVSALTIDGVAQQPGVGYFATVDPATQSLWVTLNGTVSAPVSVGVR